MIEATAIIAAQELWTNAAESDHAAETAEAAFVGFARAVEQLRSNLRELGYPEVPGLVASANDVEALIGKIESAVGGTVPPVLASLWRVAGGVSLVDLKGYAHEHFWDAQGIRGPNGFCDGVYVDACTKDWADFVIQDFVDLHDDPDLPPLSGPFMLSLAPDGYHKDNISGGASYGVSVGDGWLASWQNFSWTGSRRPESAPTGQVDLLGYLRTAILECAGFPALLGVPAFELIRGRLLRGVDVF
jgi:hypothetical protein